MRNTWTSDVTAARSVAVTIVSTKYHYTRELAWIDGYVSDFKVIYWKAQVKLLMHDHFEA